MWLLKRKLWILCMALGAISLYVYTARYPDDRGHVTEARRDDSADVKMRSVGDERAEIYLHGAFWDDRWSVGPQPVIRVLAVMETTNFPEQSSARRSLSRANKKKPHLPLAPLYCFVSCQTSARTYHVQKETTNYVAIGPARFVAPRMYDKCTVDCIQQTCTAQHDNIRVSLGYTRTSNDSATEASWEGMSIPVVFPKKPRSQDDVVPFGICVPVVFNHLDSTRLVEWFEMQKIMGVGKIFMYNDSLDESTSRTLHHYSTAGVLHVRQTRSAFSNINEKYTRTDIRIRNAMCMTDCLYRNMYTVNYILTVDVDEILVPRWSDDLGGLMGDIRARQLKGSDTKVGSYVFRNINFLSDVVLGAKPDETRPPQLRIMRNRRRHPVSNPKHHVKVIVDTMGCVALYQHHCRRLTDAYNTTELNDELPVDPDIGALHHYRGTLCNLRKTIFINCTHPTIPVIEDDYMLKYESQLSSNVARELARQGLESF